MNKELNIQQGSFFRIAMLLITINLLGGAVFAQSTRTSIKSGNWNNKNTWDCNCVPATTDNAVIATGHTVTFVSTNSVHSLTVDDEAVITDNGGANTISGDLILNGAYSGTGPINLTGSGATISGSGIISNTSTITVTNDKAILVGSDLTINNANLTINGAYTITNYGTFSCGGTITGTVSGSTWTNEVNSTLNIGGNPGSQVITALNAVGTLNASASGNTVNYTTPASVTVKLPSMVSGYNTYHNLIISGTNVKFLPDGNIAVNGDLTINSTLNASGDSKHLFLRGSWINNGNFTEGSGSGSITFDGTADQSIFRSSTENLNILAVQKPSGTLFLNADVIVETSLIMTSGNINSGTHTLTTGTSGVNPGIILWTSGTVIGKIARWLNPSFIGLPVDYPVGTASFNRHITIVFNDLSSGSLSVEFKEVAPGNNGMPLTESGITLGNTFRDGYWSLVEGNSLGNVDFALGLDGNGFDGFPINDSTRLLTRTNSSSAWTLNGSHVARTGITIRRSSIDQLGEFCFGSNATCVAPSTSAITGNNNLCTSTTNVPYSVTNTPLSIYTWTITGGTQASGGTSSSITVDWGTTGEVGSVSVVEDNGCTLGADISRSVTLNPIPPASITGKVSVPQNALPNPPYESANETYTVPAQSGYTFAWSVSGGTIVSISGTTRTLTVAWGPAGAGQVCVQSVHPTCGNSVSTCLDVNIYEIITSTRSGNWNSTQTWDCTCVPASDDNVTILNTHAVTVDGNGGVGRTIQHVNVNPGGILNIGTSQLTSTGDFNLNGTLTGTGPITLSGAGTTIDGTGTTINSGQLNISGNKTIVSTANLAKASGTVLIGASSIITNFGNITFGGNVTGGDINTTWDNKAGAQLSIGAAFLAQGELIASGSNNFVRYSGSVAQSIKEATNDQYYNLTLSGTGTKTLPAILYLMGDLNYSATSVALNNGTVIFNGTSSVFGTVDASLNNVTVTGSLTAPSTTFNIAGAFVNNGTFTHSNGTIGFNGSLPQTISGSASTDFYDISVNKGGGALLLVSTVNLVNVLTVLSSTDVQSNGNLTLVSSGDNPDTTASIAALPAAASVSGNVTIQRFMSNEGRFYRYISSPITTPTVADWQDDFAVTGNFTGKSTVDPFNNSSSICGTAIIPTTASLYRYNESTAGLIDVGYETFPVMSTNLEKGRGYAAFIRETCYRSVNMDVTGTINKGDVTLPVTYTNHGDATADGWNLVGNPYPSAINWSSASWTKTNISTAISIRDNGTGMMRYNDGTINGFNGVIAVGQAFWVQATAGAPSLIVSEGAKVASTTHSFYREGRTTAPYISVSLSRNGMEDNAYIKVNKFASIERDIYDATKLKNEIFGISTLTPEGTAMAISAVPEIGEGYRIPIKLDDVVEGTYELSFNNQNGFDEFSIELTDNEAGIRKILNWGEVHSFTATSGMDHRFTSKLIKQTSSSEIEMPKIGAYPNPFSSKQNLMIEVRAEKIGSVQLINATGIVVKDLDMTSTFPGVWVSTNNLASIPSGFYYVRTFSDSFISTIKVVKKD